MKKRYRDEAWDKHLKSSLGREPTKQEYLYYNKYKFLMSKTIVIKSHPFDRYAKELAGFGRNGS